MDRTAGHVYPTTKEQRCWVHKMANITGAMPKPMHERAKAGLQVIWMAATKKEAVVVFDLFVETYGVKCERAVKKLTKDRDVLLTFYDFPAEHWKHIRTTNPIESVFATVCSRTQKTKGCLRRKTALTMVFKLMMSAKKKWRKLSGTNRLPEVIQGVEFKDGIKQRSKRRLIIPSPTFWHNSMILLIFRLFNSCHIRPRVGPTR